jgi:hypothetical protein
MVPRRWKAENGNPSAPAAADEPWPFRSTPAAIKIMITPHISNVFRSVCSFGSGTGLNHQFGAEVTLAYLNKG